MEEAIKKLNDDISSGELFKPAMLPIEGVAIEHQTDDDEDTLVLWSRYACGDISITQGNNGIVLHIAQAQKLFDLLLKSNVVKLPQLTAAEIRRSDVLPDTHEIVPLAVLSDLTLAASKAEYGDITGPVEYWARVKRAVNAAMRIIMKTDERANKKP